LPSTAVSPVIQVCTCPAGLTFRIFELPGTTGNVLRFPMKKFPWYDTVVGTM